MGGEGSGNEGRRKFGNKFYEKEVGHPTLADAQRSADQLEKIGVKTKIVKEVYWAAYPPFNDIDGYVVYYLPTYHRPSRSTKSRKANGPRRF